MHFASSSSAKAALLAEGFGFVVRSGSCQGLGVYVKDLTEEALRRSRQAEGWSS